MSENFEDNMENPKVNPIEAEAAASICEESKFGEIRISHSVVSRIVKLAALKVPGVVRISSGGFELAGIFTKSSSGITVEDNEEGDYIISLNVVLTFGIELAKTADAIQQAVREQVVKMTDKKVVRVDVAIDDVVMPEENKEIVRAEFDAVEEQD